MRNSFLWMVLLFLATASILQCTPDNDEATGPQQIQFTFTYKSTDPSGGRVQQSVSPDALLLSLNGPGGIPVFVRQRISLLHVGESFITDPIEVTPGSYTITDFLLVAGDSVLYITPLQGSPLSEAVNRPLPYALVVSKDHSTTLDMEVLSVGTNLPEDFGYAAFNINAMNPFRISVFSGTDLTDATAYVLRDQDTLLTQHLDARINTLSFPAIRRDVLYKLIVTKRGYSTFLKPFYYDSLVAELDGLPLRATVQPRSFYIGTRANIFSMQLRGQPGTINIDWGDGTHELFALPQDSLKTVTHNYGCCGGSINIDGDIDKITHLFTDTNDIQDIHVQSLSMLAFIQIDNLQGPSEIDLSHNANLSFIYLRHVDRLNQITLPPLKVWDREYWIDLTGSNNFTTAGIDNLIDQLFTQTLPGSRMLTVPTIDGGDEFIGPPSPAGMDKLRVLRDNYQWFIRPNPN